MEIISESKQIYIRTISGLMKQNNGTVRKTDIAKELNHSKASVTYAVRRLEQDGYVLQENGNVLLTELGKGICDEFSEKRSVLTELFKSLGDDINDAKENACRMERIISDDLFCVLKRKIRPEN